MLLYMHIAGILLALTCIAVADHEMFNWMLGKKQQVSIKLMHAIHWLVWISLATLITTGVIMFLPGYQYFLEQPLFLLKLFFVATLTINAFFIGRLMQIPQTRPFSSLSRREIVYLLVSGGVSTSSWAATIAIGLYLFYPGY